MITKPPGESIVWTEWRVMVWRLELLLLGYATKCLKLLKQSWLLDFLRRDPYFRDPYPRGPPPPRDYYREPAYRDPPPFRSDSYPRDGGRYRPRSRSPPPRRYYD